MRSRLEQLHDRVYRLIAGDLPHPRIWHFQRLPQRMMYQGLPGALAELEGHVLDLGCGTQPYRDLVPGQVTGADISPGPHVDVIIPRMGAWPFEDGEFDSLLCTQVLEHAQEPAVILGEIQRVLRPGGTVVLSAPFMYHEHGSPDDYWRFSRHGLRRAVGDVLTVERVITQGGVGTILGTEILAWLETSLPAVVRGLLAPMLILAAGLVNVTGAALDRADQTGLFYGNVLVIARRN